MHTGRHFDFYLYMLNRLVIIAHKFTLMHMAQHPTSSKDASSGSSDEVRSVPHIWSTPQSSMSTLRTRIISFQMLFSCSFDGSNLVLKYNHETEQLENLAIDDTASPYYQLRDPRGSAIGVCACDVDGDGREEIYFLNTNNAYSGRKQYTDKLFKWRNGRYEDVLSDRINSNVINQYAGEERSNTWSSVMIVFKASFFTL